MIHDYLSHQKQRTRVNDSYSESLAVMFGVPQGSILGPLLINIFLAVLFFIHSDTDIASFADDNTPNLSTKIVEAVIESLERDSVSLFRWFENNLLKGKADKCHFLVSTTFDQHITDLCRAASKKIHALARVTPYEFIKVTFANSFFEFLF